MFTPRRGFAAFARGSSLRSQLSAFSRTHFREVSLKAAQDDRTLDSVQQIVFNGNGVCLGLAGSFVRVSFTSRDKQ